jgi:hypothetical protein
VNCKADGLGSSSVQPQLRTADDNAGANQVGKVGKLDAHQILGIGPLPLVFDQKVLIGRERLDTLTEALNKILRSFLGRGLAGDGLHETENVLGAVTGFTHQQVDPLLMSSAIGDVLGHDNKKNVTRLAGLQGRT